MTRIKKIFSPKICTYGDDLAKRWRVEYLDDSKKRIVIYGNINKGKTVEARMRAANLIINALRLDIPKEKSLFDKVIESAKLHWRPKTISDYTHCARRFGEWLKKRSPETAVEETINDYLAFLHKGGMNNNTIAKHRNMLFSLYVRAINSGMCSFNPVKRVPGIKRQPKSLHFFSNDQIQAFKASVMPDQLWLAIRMLFYCFIRPAEQRLLRIRDINFEYGFIEVPGEISKNKKTEKVSIPAIFQQEIEYLKEFPNNHYILSKSGRPGSTPISTKWLNDEHSKVLKALKITGRYAFYSWKHTGAVKAVKAGINIKDLQLQLRHHSLDMVNEYLKNLGVLDSEDLKHRFPTL